MTLWDLLFLFLQVLRSFLHLQLHSVDEPVGGVGVGEGRGGSKRQRGRMQGGSLRDKQNSATMTGKGSQLTRKQRKVRGLEGISLC